MGYQLIFWRENEPTSTSPAETCRALVEEHEAPPTLAELPIEDIKVSLGEVFPGLEPNGATGAFWTDEVSTVEFSWSNKHLSAELRHGGDRARLANNTIDVMLRFGCPLYDPQTDERFSA